MCIIWPKFDICPVFIWLIIYYAHALVQIVFKNKMWQRVKKIMYTITHFMVDEEVMAAKRCTGESDCV